MVESNIDNAERHKTSKGESHYPFVRHIGGVSLFDFTNIDIEVYSDRCPASSWSYFVPITSDCSESIWIEIDREAIKGNWISGPDLLRRWKDENAYSHTLMPLIEAAHIGDLPMTNMIRAISVSQSSGGFKVSEL